MYLHQKNLFIPSLCNGSWSEEMVDMLKGFDKEQVSVFIRSTLSMTYLHSHFRYIDLSDLAKEHLRFEMSGYNDNTKGKCTLMNMNILNHFANLGIYDYTHFLFIDFYKGTGTIYLKYFREFDLIEIDLTGLGTVDIIYKVFELTIFSGKPTRRRS